jgi:hypothetical protein
VYHEGPAVVATQQKTTWQEDDQTKGKGETLMGDKGGKKDKEKGQKQSADKQKQKSKSKVDRQPKRKP